MQPLAIRTALFLSLITGVACSDDTQQLQDSGPSSEVDSGQVIEPKDAGASTADAGEQPPPARRLIDIDLFGDMPLDNAIVDPQFDPSSQSWIAVGDLQAGGRFVRSSFRDLARTPAGLPAQLIPARDTDPTDTVLLGSASALGTPITASVWIGRNAADSAALTQAHPFVILTLADSGLERAFDLAPDAETATVAMDGAGWQRYAATINEASVGILTFAVEDRVHLPMYVHAPILIGRSMLRLSAPIARPRALSVKESRAAQMIADWRRRRLGESGQKVESPLSPKLMKAVLRHGTTKRSHGR